MKRCRKKRKRVLVKRKNSEVVKAFRNEGGLYCIKNSDTFSSIILKPEGTLWTDLPIPYAISEGSETRWIPMSERKPKLSENEKKILISTNGLLRPEVYVVHAVYGDDDGWWLQNTSNSEECAYITKYFADAWMPIPEESTEEQERNCVEERKEKGLTRIVLLNNTVYQVRETPDKIMQISANPWVRVTDEHGQTLQIRKDYITTLYRI